MPGPSNTGPASGPRSGTDQHRNALLGMFKKAAGSESPVTQAQPPVASYPQELSTAPLELSIDNLSMNQQPHHQQHHRATAPAYGYQGQNQRPQQPQQAMPSPPQPGSGAPAPEQKRQLLSLFSKQQGRPAGVVHEMGNGGGNGPAENPRSRVASLASAGGDIGSGESSRRGSQTPISPADESFLLGYLQSVTKASR